MRTPRARPLGDLCRLLALVVGAVAASSAQAPESPRPRPYPIIEAPAFTRAVERGTRTRTGRPGSEYWQQWAEYRLEAELDPKARRLSGRATVRYHNRSPDTLPVVYLHLDQNVYAPTAVRNQVVPVTGGVELTRVAAQGRPLAPVAADAAAPGYTVQGTILRVRPDTVLPPGGSLALDLAWAFDVPEQGLRDGRDSTVYVLAYWYPRLAVYDDLSGWHLDPYLGTAEFYMGYADYDVALSVPAGWLVAATGRLDNAAEVLAPATRARLDGVRLADTVVHVVTQQEWGAGKATAKGRKGRLTWRFTARNVRDFAWAASGRYLWDATRAVVGDAGADGRPDTTAIYTFYRPTARTWDHSARYARHAVEFLSRYLWPYPYPHMTAVDGVESCAGMEYPMMTCIGGPRDTLSLYSVTVHEIGHMWFPMQVGSDETRYAWQDEGLTRFNQAGGMAEFFPGFDRLAQSRRFYLAVAAAGDEVELMRHGDLYPAGTPAYGVASYDKMATNLATLRALLGEETFLGTYREYGRRWVSRHPAPEDFWNTFADVTGRDLRWFWRTWWFETWTLDQAIAAVRPGRDSVEIEIEDRGLAPMPARLVVTREGGGTDRWEVPVDVWLAGARHHILRVAARPAVIRVEIDPEGAFPDADRSNQVWSR